MRYLFKTQSSDSDYDAEIGSAFVDIDKELAQTIMKRRKLFLTAKAEDDELLEMYFWDGNAHWIDGGEADDDEKADFDEDYRVTECDWDEDHEARTEVDQMVISAQGVAWICAPKHTDIYINTPNLAFAEVEKIL